MHSPQFYASGKRPMLSSSQGQVFNFPKQYCIYTYIIHIQTNVYSDGKQRSIAYRAAQYISGQFLSRMGEDFTFEDIIFKISLGLNELSQHHGTFPFSVVVVRYRPIRHASIRIGVTEATQLPGQSYDCPDNCVAPVTLQQPKNMENHLLDYTRFPNAYIMCPILSEFDIRYYFIKINQHGSI